LTFRRSFTQESVRGFYYEEAFLHEDVGGFIGVNQHDSQCVVQAFNLTTRESLRMETKIKYVRLPVHWLKVLLIYHQPLDDSAQFACFGFEGHLYVAVEEEACLYLHQFPRDTLPYGSLTRKHSTLDLSPKGPFALDAQDVPYDPLCITLPSTASYGVSAVFIRHAQGYGRDPADTIIRFSPNRLADDPESPLSFHDSIGLTATLPGTLYNLRLPLIWLDHSGSNLVALMEFSETLSLKLVRYDRHRASVSVHELQIPSSIDLRTITTLAIDETLGAVILVDATGVLLFLPYA
jgi:hypothetical protein